MLPVTPAQASHATQELLFLVTPAQAGAQLSLFKSQNWVPAFAGMTMERIPRPKQQALHKSKSRKLTCLIASRIAHAILRRRANPPTS